jgi:hypothetical protein
MAHLGGSLDRLGGNNLRLRNEGAAKVTKERNTFLDGAQRTINKHHLTLPPDMPAEEMPGFIQGLFDKNAAWRENHHYAPVTHAHFFYSSERLAKNALAKDELGLAVFDGNQITVFQVSTHQSKDGISLQARSTDGRRHIRFKPTHGPGQNYLADITTVDDAGRENTTTITTNGANVVSLFRALSHLFSDQRLSPPPKRRVPTVKEMERYAAEQGPLNNQLLDRPSPKPGPSTGKSGGYRFDHGIGTGMLLRFAAEMKKPAGRKPGITPEDNKSRPPTPQPLGLEGKKDDGGVVEEPAAYESDFEDMNSEAEFPGTVSVGPTKKKGRNIEATGLVKLEDDEEDEGPSSSGKEEANVEDSIRSQREEAKEEIKEEANYEDDFEELPEIESVSGEQKEKPQTSDSFVEEDIHENLEGSGRVEEGREITGLHVKVDEEILEELDISKKKDEGMETGPAKPQSSSTDNKRVRIKAHKDLPYDNTAVVRDLAESTQWLTQRGFAAFWPGEGKVSFQPVELAEGVVVNPDDAVINPPQALKNLSMFLDINFDADPPPTVGQVADALANSLNSSPAILAMLQEQRGAVGREGRTEGPSFDSDIVDDPNYIPSPNTRKRKEEQQLKKIEHDAMRELRNALGFKKPVIRKPKYNG